MTLVVTLEIKVFTTNMKRLSESIWSDIHKRSNGSEIRKEDDIEHLDRDEMLDYIYSIYDVNEKINATSALKSEVKDTKAFSLAVFIYGTSLYRLLVGYQNDKVYRIILLANEYDCDWCYDKLESKFNLTKQSNGSVEIKSKELTVSNSLILEIIETINECIEQANTHNTLQKMLIKKEN